jgi:hypothetical protein
MSAFGGDSTQPLEWVGRACAIIERWNVAKFPVSSHAGDQLRCDYSDDIRAGHRTMYALLHQARAALRMEVGPLSTVLQQGHVFDYFDEVRRQITVARSDLLFVDPYLDADFVSTYLSHVSTGVTIRLLTSEKKLSTLLPAVDMFVKQYGRAVEVRTSAGLHDRFVFVDRSSGYFSGASFKDGAKHAPALLSQVLDAFDSLWQTYEAKWSAGKVER